LQQARHLLLQEYCWMTSTSLHLSVYRRTSCSVPFLAQDASAKWVIAVGLLLNNFLPFLCPLKAKKTGQSFLHANGDNKHQERLNAHTMVVERHVSSPTRRDIFRLSFHLVRTPVGNGNQETRRPRAHVKQLTHVRGFHVVRSHLESLAGKERRGNRSDPWR
jgi:hypothetical protein